MKNLLVALVLSLNTAAFASNNYTRCDLAGTYPEDAKELEQFAVKSDTAVTPLQALQIIETAKWQNELFKDYGPIENYDDALQILGAYSDTDDLIIKTLKINNEVFTAVVHYPGDNEYGLLFQGSNTAIEIQDGDFYCPGLK